MSSLAKRQIELVQRLDAEIRYWLDGVVGVMHVGGVGGKLNEFRRGREANRPPCVTLEPRRNGQIMLGLVVSRPKNGRLVYDTVLGHWDLSVPIHPGGPLNENKPRHRRVAAWGLQMLRWLADYGRQVRNGNASINNAVMAMPRVLIPFDHGTEKIDFLAQHTVPDAVIDAQSVAGKTLVDARIVPDAEVAKAIDNDTALEDFRPVLGQHTPNPFRFGSAILGADGKTVPLSAIYDGAAPEILAAARRFVGRGVESGATDSDLVAAAAEPQKDMYLSLFSKIQVVPVETLAELPEPYAGHAMPPVSWRTHKNQSFNNAISS